MKTLKNKFIKRITFLLTLFLGCLAVSSISAQNCDINTQKSLEETHVSYFDKVTQGDDAIFTIKYPLIGTTYIISDNLGATYSYTHTSGTDEFISINAGAVNAERRFSLKAQKDGCTYQTGFAYTVKPVTTLQLATRVEHEWCGSSGAIRFTLVGIGADNTQYNFYYKKSSDPTYDTSTSLPLTGKTSLPAGMYDVKATPKSGTGDLEVNNIEIKKDIKTINYTLSQIPATCASSGLGIKVDVSSANYPVYYTLQTNAGVDIPGKIRQTSNIFTGLAPDTYKVKVENFCTEHLTPKSITINNSTFSLTHIIANPTPREYGCDYIDFNTLWIYGTDVSKAIASDALPYPFTVRFVLTSPSGKVYTPTYTITNKQDLDTYMPLTPWGNEGLGLTNGLREHRIPREYGVWQIGAEIDMCGTTTTLATVTDTLYNPIENARVVQTAGGNSLVACHKERLIITNKYRRDTAPILNTYLVIEQAPANFKYAEAGFYQITTTNPLLNGKYLKQMVYNPWEDTEILSPDFLRAGDVFKFRLVDGVCSSTRSNLMGTVTVTISSAAQTTEVDIHNVGSCKGATLTGAPYVSMRIKKGSGSPIDKLEIIDYNGQTTGLIPSTSISLPYTLTENDRANENTWYVRDLPPGIYQVRITNICGGTYIKPKTLTGQTYSLTFAPGCEPKVVGTITHTIDFNGYDQETEFIIQYFREVEQFWDQHLRANGYLSRSEANDKNLEDQGFGKKGKFRIIRRVRNPEGNYSCEMVLAEREFKGDLQEPEIVGFGCGTGGNKKYHLMIIPKGGTAPYTYKLVHKLPAGSTTPDTSVAHTQVGDNFFLNLDGANVNNAYKFSVTDACPATKEREITIANVQTPTITAEKLYYCVGQPAQLTVPDLGPNVTIKWYRSDAPTVVKGVGATLNIPALTNDDFTNSYSVQLSIPTEPTVEACISNAIAAYQFQRLTATIAPIPATNTETVRCVASNEDFDVMTLFTGLPTTLPTGVTTRVVETSGVLAITNDNKIKIRYAGAYQRPMGWGTHTFRYEILSPCGVVEQSQEAKLTVKPYLDFNPKTTIKVCNATVTLAEIKQLVIEGSPKVAELQPIFSWHSSYSDAEAGISEIPSTTSITTSNGSTTVRYLRLIKEGYCNNNGVYTITIKGETSVTPKVLANTGCDVTTIADLKALVDPVDAQNVVIYKDGIEQSDNALVETTTGYSYAKNVYDCITASATLTFNLNARIQAKNERVNVCTYIGYYGGLNTTVGAVRDALGEIYPSTSIKIYNNDKSEYTSDTSQLTIGEQLYFKLQKTGMCESLLYSVRIAQASMTVVETKSITICEEITVGELAAHLESTYSYTNVQIHQDRGTSVMPSTAFVDWNSALYFSAEETGKCRSTKVPLILIKNANVTTATAKTFEVCKMPSETPKVSALKSVITGGDVRIFIRNNNNQWILQADTDNVDPSKSYFYTLQATGKCPSEKTPLIVNLLDRPTAAPTVSPTVSLCPTSASNVVSLDTYVTPLAAHTLRWYANATATISSTTAPTINTQVTTKTTVVGYVVYVNGNGCESPKAVVTVTVEDTDSPTLTVPEALLVDCKNTASITQWLGTASATDSCGSVNLTNDYNTVKPADLCNNSGVVTVTFTAKDLFGNTTTETRTITLVMIEAKADTFSITHGATATRTTKSVLNNDRVGTQTATAATVSMTVVSPAVGAAGSATPTLENDGTISIPEGTKSGTYTIGYQICTTVASVTACSNATATIVVGAASLTAKADTFTVTNGANGGSAGNVLTNDAYNGTTGLVGNASVTLSWGNLPAGIQTTTTVGELKVPAGTPAGTYTISYRLCEALNNDNCSTATATIVVGAASLTAKADTFTVTNGANGGSAGNVLTNDAYNGTTGLVGNTSVTLSWDNLPAGIQTTTTAGELKVSAGTASGTYKVGYKLCENLVGNNNCSVATATIVVGQASITAAADTFSVTNGANGGAAGNVLTNDAYNGTTGLVGNTSVTLSWDNLPAGIQTTTTVGELKVAAGTASGTYKVGYKLCEKLIGNNNCSVATATIVVGQASITANADTFTVTNGVNGGTAGNVLTNDAYNGTTGLVGNTSVTLSWDNLPAGIQTTTTVGELKVAAGTRSGTYKVGYKLCENLVGNNNCSVATATIVVGAAPLKAEHDDFVIANGAIGGTTSNVLTNDEYNGQVGLVGNTSVTLSWGNLPAGIQTTTTAGELRVPAGTPQGVYTVTYTLCEVLNNDNCSTNTVTVAVGVSLLLAHDDTLAIPNGANGGTTSSVLNNDSYNGITPPSAGTVSLTWINVPAGMQTNTNGEISVPAGTPAGTYTASYRLCEVLNPSNCSGIATATIVVGQASITATADTFSVTNGANGGAAGNVLANDAYNGTTGLVGNASVTLSWDNLPAGIQTTTTVGELKVAAGTASGTYKVGYKLCENLIGNNNCSVATATIVVGQASLTANADTFTVTNGANGGSAGNVLTNDEYNGTTGLVGNASVTLNWDNLPAGIQTTTTVGELKVPAGTPAGTYTISYRLCEALNNDNCSTATATIVVGQASLTANADTFTVTNGANGGTTGNVLTNDEYNGTTGLVGNASVTLSWGNLPAGIQTTTTAGELKVPAGTPAGTYTISYRLCEAMNNSNCSTATATIVVGQASLTANVDTFTVTNGANGGSAGNVLTNDTYNGTTGLVGNTSVTLSWDNLPAGIQTTTTVGELKVPANTPAGTYTVSYRLCEAMNNSNCSTASATIVVGAAPIKTEHDDFVIANGGIGGTTSNVLTNDEFNGQVGLVGNTSVTLSWGNLPAGIQTTTTVGELRVPAGTPQGVYTVTYTLCEVLNNDNCSTNTVTVAVGVSLLLAHDDTLAIPNGANGGTTSSVLNNDSYNGITPPSAGTVSLTWISVPAGMQTNTNGEITVPAGTPAGTYTVSYRLCEALNSGNCSIATATIEVGAATLTAKADTFTITSGTNGTIGNVLTNDEFNGQTGLVGNTSVTLSWDNLPAGIQTTTTVGELKVSSGIPVGTYTVTYRLCEVLNSSNCSTVSTTIVVTPAATVTPSITVVGDEFTGTITSTTSPTIIGNVLTNDKIGTDTPTVGSVTVHTASPTTPNTPYIEPSTGEVIVPAGTPTGTYTMTYYLCEKANSSNCSSATTVTATVVGVSSPTSPIHIVANTDSATFYVGTGGTCSSVLENDSLDGVPVTTGTVSFTWDTTSPSDFTLHNDGTVTVGTNAAVGLYTISYTICATRDADRACATSFIVIDVISPTVTPTIVVKGETFTYTGTPLVGNVLTNEVLNGVPNPSVNSVTISVLPPMPGVNEPFLNPSTGEVMVPPTAPAGTYTISYSVCAKGTSECGTGTVTVIVPQTASPTGEAPIAIDDVANTLRNTPVTVNVMANDTTRSATTPNVVGAPLNGTTIVNADGSITYTPNNDFVGTDSFVYELCNTEGCATATVRVEVANKLVPYNGMSVNGDGQNDYFHIAGIENYPDNVVRIYNRWGVEVFNTNGYDNATNVFRGLSTGRVTIEAPDLLPQGTYFYIIEYTDENNQKQKLVGWLYLKR